ncbi:MAG: ATP-binding protein [Planctomycetota bacterium]|jgi:PAS domain S-box-containing protein
MRKLPRVTDLTLHWKLNAVVAMIAGPLLFAVAYLLARNGHPTALEVLAIGLICASCVGVGLRVVHRMADRIRNITESAERIGEEMNGDRLPEDGSDEIGRLAGVLNETIARVQRANADLARLVGEHMETLELQNSILDNAAEFAILSDDPSGRILSANRGAMEILGLESVGDAVGTRLSDWVVEDEASSGNVAEMVAVTDGGNTWHGALKCRRRDGSVFPASCRVAARRDRRGSAAGRVILLRDTSREREAERRYSELFHSLQEAVYVTSPEGQFLDANEAMAQLLGYETLHDLQRVDARVLYRNVGERARWLELVERRGFIRDHEVCILSRLGDERVCIESTRALLDDQGDTIAYLGTLVDITERRRLERQVARSQRLDAVGTLASGLAHDFNNILAAIVPNTELIERHRDCPEPVRDRARTIRAAAERAGGITRQLLRFARQGTDAESSADVNALAKESAHLLEPGFSEDVAFELVLGEDVPAVAGDATSLQQVCVNLVLNARDACGERGTVRLRTRREDVRQTAHGLRKGTYGVISVEDDGEGMSQADLDRIFDPFFTTKASGVGTGLGLSVVYAIVTGYGGHIAVRSEPGRGTSFDIYLPEAVQNSAPAESESPGASALGQVLS